MDICRERNAREEIIKAQTNSSVRIYTPADNNIRVSGYLVTTCKIKGAIVDRLLGEGLLYQEERYNNAVFINKERTCTEVFGTLSNKPFTGPCDGPQRNQFWYFSSEGIDFWNDENIPVYITKNAIDAISLYDLMRYYAKAAYVSMGGSSNQQIIDRLVALGRYRVIIAVGNDEEGKQCRERNSNLPVLVPTLSDWSSDLKEGIKVNKIIWR